LIIEGVLRLGQFTTANAPSGAEGALYFDTTEKKTKVYSSAAWTDLGGGWDGILPNYTTAQRTAIASPEYGMMIYNTDSARVEYYLPDNWTAIQAPFATAHSCTAAIDCASEICVDGYCCNTLCTGNCNRCNVVGSLGTCTDVASDCTGNCDVCSAGNCAAVQATCTGNCDTCSGSGTAYSCAASDSLCTGNCDVCSGSGLTYNCAASNALCSNDASSCYCSGSGTVFNCQTCPDTYGVCGHPTCSSYACGNAYDNGVACATCKTCSSGSCSVFVPAGSTGLNCTAAHYRCNGSGGCTAPCTGVAGLKTCGTSCPYSLTWDCCVSLGYARCTHDGTQYWYDAAWEARTSCSSTFYQTGCYNYTY